MLHLKANTLILLISIFANCNSFFAQNIDSLKLALSNEKEDTSKIFILEQLVENISDDNVWPVYNEQLLQLSEKVAQNKNVRIKQVGKEGLADAFNNVGFIYNNQGDIPKALDYFGRSLKIQEEINDKQGIAEALSNIGVIYYYQNDKEKALDYYLKSLKIREELGIKEDIANSLNNIGNLYYMLGKMKEALDFSNRSLKLQEEIGDKQGISYSLNNLGAIYFNQGDIPKTLDYYAKSLAIRKEIGDKQGYAASLHNLGVVYLKMYNGSSKAKQNLNLAKSYTDSSLVLSRELGFPDNIRNAERLYSQIDSAYGNYASAFEHYKQFIIYRDSITNEANHRESMKSQMKYVFEKKEAILLEQHDKEKAIGKERERVQKIIIWSVVGGLFLLLVFLLFIYSSLRQNKRANKIITQQKELVETKNHIIEEKQKEIVDSINYAKRIQYSLLAHTDFLNEFIPQNFIYFNPKDIVSGDFYWATKSHKKFYLAVCDSTGHGVPGAFMSLLNIGFLSEAINEKDITAPDKIFNYVRTRLTSTISKEGQKDGFDGVLLCVDLHTKQITYAAANNKPVIIQNNELIQLPADKMPVGVGERNEGFNLYTINHKGGDILYLYTDGFADQFGGPKGKKFKYKPLNELIINMNSEELSAQREKLHTAFESWRGDLEQVDDVCIIGIRL
ncbi:MAG: tetratricopeptide repeat protein [Bacteroidota bacterium]|nr:tetratricopeptide repeat protein [Bacteroidota bacterium]